MGKTFHHTKKARNPNWIDLMGRKPGFMKDKREPRGGARNLLHDLADDLNQEEEKDTYVSEDISYRER